MGLFIKQYMILPRNGLDHDESNGNVGSERQSLLSNEVRRRQVSSISEGFEFIALLICLVFLEAIGLYGLIIAVFFISSTNEE